MLKQLFLSTFRYYPGTLKLLKITLAITATSLNTRGPIRFLHSQSILDSIAPAL